MTTDHGPLARGAAVGVVTVVAERAVAFVVIVVLARVLPADEFGRYGYVLAGLTLVQVLVDQGVEVAAVALRSGDPTARVLGAVLRWRGLVWAALAVPVGVALLPALGGDVGAAVGLAASGVVLVGPSITARSLRRARGDLAGMGRVALADAVLGGVAVIVAATSGCGLAVVFGARAAASLLVSGIALAGERAGAVTGPAVPATMASLLPVAGPLAVSALLIAIQTRAGYLVAMSVAGPLVVARLAAAVRATEVLGVLPEGVLLAVFPRMASAPGEAGGLAAAAARAIAVLVLAPVVALSVGGAAAMTLLFGAAYAPAGGAVAILAWSALLSVTGGVALHALVAGGAQRFLVVANAVAASFGVALQILLVGRLGLEGAALATVATVALGQLTLLAMPATRPVVARVWWSVLPVALLAAVVAGATAALRPGAIGAGVAVAVYAVLVALSGMIGVRERRALRAAIARRGRVADDGV